MKLFWLGICACVGVLGAFQLYVQFIPYSATFGRDKTVASLSRLQGTVNHRPATSLLWHPISAGWPLQTGDALLTSPDSQAEIVWASGEKVKLAGGIMFLIPTDPRGLAVTRDLAGSDRAPR